MPAIKPDMVTGSAKEMDEASASETPGRETWTDMDTETVMEMVQATDTDSEIFVISTVGMDPGMAEAQDHVMEMQMGLVMKSQFYSINNGSGDGSGFGYSDTSGDGLGFESVLNRKMGYGYENGSGSAHGYGSGSGEGLVYDYFCRNMDTYE